MDLASFLTSAPTLFGETEVQGEEIEPDIAKGTHHGALRRFQFENGDFLSCIRWDSKFHITSTDIIRALVHRFEDIKRPVVNIKKFEEGVFSDLRSLKPGKDARLELPRSEFLDILYKHHCVRTQKKQKVFFWESVPHDMLFRDALERDLKREAMGIEPTTKVVEGTDPSSLVEIGGVELPLSVPPTLAVHPRKSNSGSSVALAATTAPVVAAPDSNHNNNNSGHGVLRTNTALSTASLVSMASSTYNDDPVDSGDNCIDILRFATSNPGTSAQQQQQQQQPQKQQLYANSNSSQPTLSEYINCKVAAAAAAASTSSSTAITDMAIWNGNWTGMDFQALQRHASGLKTAQDEFPPTPTPHHSPKHGAAHNEEGLLELLSNDPNALVTQENVGDFNLLLEQMLASTGGAIQESGSLSIDTSSRFMYDSNMCQQQFYGQPTSSSASLSMALDPTIGTSASAAVSIAGSGSMDVDMSCGGRTPLPTVIMDSINSTPSATTSVINNSNHITPSNHTPDPNAAFIPYGGTATNGSVFVSSTEQSNVLDELNNLLANVESTATKEPSSPPLNNPLDGLIPMMNSSQPPPPPQQQLSQSQSFTAGLAQASKSFNMFNQMWPTTTKNATPRSTRFSRFHPYMRTMQRRAYRGSTSLLNRLPSTADPAVAAAAVNAMAAKFDNGETTAVINGGAADGELKGVAVEDRSSSSSRLLPIAIAPSASTTAVSPAICDTKIADDTEANKSKLYMKVSGVGESRKFTCTYNGCNKQFKRHEHLKRHFRTHTGEKPYVCPAKDCKKRFARMDNLSQHIRTHVNRKVGGVRRDIGIGSQGIAKEDRALLLSSIVPAKTTTQQQQQQQMKVSNDLPPIPPPPRMEETDLKQKSMATASPLIENNTVTDLPRMSESNRAPQDNNSQQQQQQVMKLPPLPSSPSKTFQPLSNREGDTQQRPLAIPSNPVDTSQASSMPVADDVSSSSPSNINTIWLASFLAQGQHQQQQQMQKNVGNGVGFTMNGQLGNFGVASSTSQQQRMLKKRHLDEDDVAMTSGDERHPQPSPSSTKPAPATSSKFVRSSIASKPHISAV